MTSQHSRRKYVGVVCGLGMFFLVDPENLVAQEQELIGEDVYHYTPAGKRDPFYSPFSAVAPEIAGDEAPKTPLQRFDLGQLKLVGVIWETDEPRALVEDSGGLGYIVTRGTLIGSRGGVVKTIEPKRVVIEEYETDFFGKRQTQEKEMHLTVTESSQEKKKDTK
jgi:Tfp pilus assembly protein PilP